MCRTRGGARGSDDQIVLQLVGVNEHVAEGVAEISGRLLDRDATLQWSYCILRGVQRAREDRPLGHASSEVRFRLAHINNKPNLL